MRVIINKLREKYVNLLIYAFIPLSMLTFLWEPDSLFGKLLLGCKFMFMGILYLFYADKQKWYTHVLLVISVFSMTVSVLSHGNTGVVLLILTMLFAFCVFPKIELPHKKLSIIYLLFSISVIFVIIFSILTNYRRGLTAFFYHGTFNPNVLGMLLLSAFFYLVSYLQLKHNSIITLSELLVIIAFFSFILLSGCRSALLSLLVFIVIYILRESKIKSMVYYLITASSILICFVTILITYQSTEISNLASFEIFGKKLMSGREKVWNVLFNGFISSPLFGTPIEYLQKHTGLASAHNVFMGIMFSVGIIPCFTYTKFIFSPNDLFPQMKSHKQNLSINQLCFIASIVISAFECVFTDNRLNLLFLPLLLGLNSDNAHPTENTIHSNSYERSSFTKQLLTFDRSSFITIIMTSFIFLSILAEPLALKLTRHGLPQKADQAYLDYIGYGNSQINVLSSYKGYNEQSYGIFWNWDNDSYSVIGNAEGFSFKDFYHSDSTLPVWAIPGGKYHAIYESDSVKLRIYYYSLDGQWISIVYTTKSVDFTIPVDATGLIVRIELSAGDSAFEKVMPIIYSLEDEPVKMRNNRIIYPTLMNQQFYEEVGYIKDSITNLIDSNGFPSNEYQGIIWEWSGDAYNVSGTATQFSFFDFYNSSSMLPKWAIPGKQYHVMYEANSVKFRIYYFSPEGQWINLVYTTKSVDFTLPYNALGLIIRLELSADDSAFEEVMPIIYAIDDEPEAMRKNRTIHPTLMNQEFFDRVSCDKDKVTNLIGNVVYPSLEYQGIVWEWNGNAYNVRGTANEFSFFDFYNSSSVLPIWAVPGKQYKVLFEAESIRFRIYYYSPEGQWQELVTTKSSTSFTFPEDANGLIIRIELDPGQSVLESVMPWIFPVE